MKKLKKLDLFTKNIPEVAKEKAKKFTKISEDTLFDVMFNDIGKYLTYKYLKYESNNEEEVKTNNKEYKDTRTNIEKTDDDAFLYLQPIGLDENDSEQEKKINRYSNTIKKMNERWFGKTGKNMSIEDVFAFFAEKLGAKKSEENFNLFKKAFEQSGIEYDKSS